MQPLVSDIVRGGSYKQFHHVLHSSLGRDPGWQQLALMFKLTQSAVQMVGMGTAAALHIKEMSLRYFEDKFASWIVEQGGWVSLTSALTVLHSGEWVLLWFLRNEAFCEEKNSERSP